MAYLSDEVLDQGLSRLSGNKTVTLCSAEPTTYTAATTSLMLGSQADVNISVPEAGIPNGRQVTVPVIAGGSISGTGTATHWAVVDPVATALLAVGSLAAPEALETGSVFNTVPFTIRMPEVV